MSLATNADKNSISCTFSRLIINKSTKLRNYAHAIFVEQCKWRGAHRRHSNSHLFILTARANNKTEIRMHLFKYHVTRDVGPKACEVCGKVFRYLDTLKTHEKIHSTPSLMCDTCGKGFHRPTALQASVFKCSTLFNSTENI